MKKVYSEKEKLEIYDILTGAAGGSVLKCMRLTGASRTTVEKVRREFTNREKSAPTPEELLGMIIGRVAVTVTLCKDPKKLMETYALVRELLCSGDGGQDGLEKIIAQFGGSEESAEG